MLDLAFYNCLPTSSASLAQLEAASVMPNLWMVLLRIYIFLKKVSLRVLFFFSSVNGVQEWVRSRIALFIKECTSLQ